MPDASAATSWLPHGISDPTWHMGPLPGPLWGRPRQVVYRSGITTLTQVSSSLLHASSLVNITVLSFAVLLFDVGKPFLYLAD